MPTPGRRNLSTLTNIAAPFRYNNFGGTVGGPVWAPGMNQKFRRKALLLRRRGLDPIPLLDTASQAVPTTLMRQGNFSELLSPNSLVQRRNGGSTIPAPAPASGRRPAHLSRATSFPPAVSQNGMAIINAYPAPTPGSCREPVTGSPPAAHPINQRKGTINIDIQPNDKTPHFGPAHGRFVFRIPAVRSELWASPPSTSTVPTRPTPFPGRDHQPHAGQRSPCHFQPGRCLHPGEHRVTGFNRSQFGINYPYLFARQRHSGQNPHGQPAELHFALRRALSVAFLRTHLDRLAIP